MKSETIEGCGLFVMGITAVAMLIVTFHYGGRESARLEMQREAIERGYGELVATEPGTPAEFRWKEVGK